jgi:O-antigen ligase
VNKHNWLTLIKYLQKIAWAMFLIFLPVTSFPYFPSTIGGSVLVRPLSLYPLLILLIIATLPYIFTKRLSPTLISLVPFIIVVLGSSLLALGVGLQSTLNIPVAERTLRALITLGVGVAIFITVAVIPRNREDLDASLRWIYFGFSAALLWGSLQAVYVMHFSGKYYRTLNRIQQYISTRRLFTIRISGLTYEPNWFAEQITFLLLPWLLASVITGKTVFPWRRQWLTLEWLLLVWSVAVLLFTYSRAGLIILIVLAAASLLFLRPVNRHPGKKSWLSGWSRRLLEASVAMVMMGTVIFFAGRNNDFFSRIWNYWRERENTSVTEYLEYLAFGARFFYGETALEIFNDNPIIGVGIGNFAYYFDEYLPDRPVAPTPEVLRLLTPEGNRNRLVTPKIFYLRILAETGLVGMAAFAAFLLAIFGNALFMWLSPPSNSEAKFWGTAGILGFLAFILAAFTFDSFALPNTWVVFGMITASSWVIHRSRKGERSMENTPKTNQTGSSIPILPQHIDP